MYSFKELKTGEDALDLSNLDKESHHGIPQAVINIPKLDILKSYQHVFGDINLDELHIQPILMPRNVVMTRIEQLYDKQMELLLKNKSTKGLNFVAGIHKNLREKFANSKNYSYQALSNLLYSINRYANFPEIRTFDNFLHHGDDWEKILSHLYLRQFVKIVGHVNFIAHKTAERDPYKIFLPYDVCLQIIKCAFFTEEALGERAYVRFKKIHPERQPVGYYQFLNCLGEIEFDSDDVPMLEILNSLYAQKKPEDFKKVLINFNSYNIENSKYDSGNSYTNHFATQEKKEVRAHAEQAKNKKESFESLLGEEPKREAQTEDKEDAAMKAAAQAEKNERELFGLVKEELSDFAKKYVANFVNDNKLANKIAKTKFEGIVQQVYKKLFYLAGAIFLSNKKKFFKILRSKEEKEEHLQKYWTEVNELVKQLRTNEKINSAVARNFLQGVLAFGPLKEQLKFFLDFQLKTTSDVLKQIANVSVGK